jgi:phenylpropionate dioxygenase-like ring-hydroxylating dioxygenase large terminal subunit
MGFSGSKVALDSDVADRLVDYIRNQGTDLAASELQVPIEHFVSPRRAEAEIALFKRLPLIVAHISELKAAGDFITREVLGMALLIVRKADGSVATYHNMCRHRGGRVEQREAGHRALFTCRYHGWSYDAEDGALRSVPYEEPPGSVDRACNSLHKLRTDVRHGLIFVWFDDGEAGSIADYLGPEVDAQLAPWGLDSSVIVLDKTFTLKINWKLVLDGAVDSLHPQFLHPKPGGVGSRVVSNVAVFKEFGRHGKLFQARAKVRTLLEAGEPPTSSTQYLASLLVLYPNALFIGAPDHTEAWTLWPSLTDPSECTLRIRFFARPEILSPDMEARINRSWEVLREAATEEDWPMEVWIQENARARPDGAFLYSRNEKAAQHLHRQLARDLDGAA